MTKYKFGVMSKKWELESDDMIQAHIAMSLWVKQNVPVAVYEPQSYGFMPQEILATNLEVADGKKLKKIMETIKDLTEE